jgi:hypothetical protein
LAKPTQPADFDIRDADGNLIDFEVLDFDMPNDADRTGQPRKNS